MDKSQAGFSLVEIILVTLLVGFIILFIGNIPSALKLVGSSSHESLAKEIASKKIEDSRSVPFDNLALGASPIGDSRLTSLPGGSGQVTVSACPDSICPTQQEKDLVKQVSIQVSWSEAGQTKNIQINTLITKDGLK